MNIPFPHLASFMLLATTCLTFLTLIQWPLADQIRSNKVTAALAHITSILPSWASIDENSLKTLETHHVLQLDQCGHHRLYQTETLGYGGPITILGYVTYDHHQWLIQGIRVIPPHHETPGLGDQIMADQHDWILQFEQRPLQPNMNVDGITGATISTEAVIKGVDTIALMNNNTEVSTCERPIH